METYAFRRTCIGNNRLLAGYVEELRSGGEIGNARVQLSDVIKVEFSENVPRGIPLGSERVDTNSKVKIETNDGFNGKSW